MQEIEQEQNVVDDSSLNYASNSITDQQIINGLWAIDILKGGTTETEFGYDYLDFLSYFELTEQPECGQSYTISWDDLKIEGTSDLFINFYLWSGSWNNAIAGGKITNQGKGSISFNIPNDFSLSGVYRLGIHRYKNNSGGSITNLKLMKAKMTSEDAQNRIIKLESEVNISSKVYVSSSQGNDNNSGDENNPIATIGRAKALGAQRIFLKCNDVFYESIGLNYNILDSYGYGSKPTITGYREVEPTDNLWIEESANKWKLNLSSEKIKGFPFKEMSSEMSVCHIYDVAEDKVRGDKVEQIDYLKQNYQFYQADQEISDIHLLYMYLDFNPNTISLRLASKIKIISCSNSEIRNIRIEGGNYAINGHSNNIIEDIEIDCIGGGFAGYPSGLYTRAGNGIEWYTLNGKSNNIVRNCKISRVYDAALTIQGTSTGTIKNIIIDNNIISNCGQAFEMWSKNENKLPTFENCVFSNNLCVNNDSGDNGFPKRKIHAFILSYGMEQPANMSFINNVFFNGNFYYAGERKYNDNKKYSFKRNTVYIKRGQYLLYSALDNKTTITIPEYSNDSSLDQEAIKKYRELANDYSTNIIIDENLYPLSEVLKLTK